MRLTIIYPAIGHDPDQPSALCRWLEPLPVAQIAGLTPPDIGLTFYDDRLESIPFDAPTDAVILTFDTWRARRAYQIASDYRRRGVPVIACGAHPSLLPDEVALYAEAVVQGELEGCWEALIDDLRHDTLQKHYHSAALVNLGAVSTDRRIFRGKTYLPFRLLEISRGCRFACEFCATPTLSNRQYRVRPAESILREIGAGDDSRQPYLLTDDNFAGNLAQVRELLPLLGKLKLRWAARISIDAAHDDSFLAQLAASGCRCVSVGFETLDSGNLQQMGKQFNAMRGGYLEALKNLRRHRLAVYGSFIFGYANDSVASLAEAVDFALEQRLFLAGFRPLTPLPGTPLYSRLHQEGRLLHAHWWRQAQLPANPCVFNPQQMTADELSAGCTAAQQRFYRPLSLLQRSLAYAHRSDLGAWRQFFEANRFYRQQPRYGQQWSLGDERWHGELLEAVC